MDKMEALDPEETPQSRHRKKLAKNAKIRKESVKAEESWFEHYSGKIIKKTKMANGSLHTTFVGMVKNNQALVEQLKKSHGIKGL